MLAKNLILLSKYTEKMNFKENNGQVEEVNEWIV